MEIVYLLVILKVKYKIYFFKLILLISFVVGGIMKLCCLLGLVKVSLRVICLFGLGGRFFGIGRIYLVGRVLGSFLESGFYFILLLSYLR